MVQRRSNHDEQARYPEKWVWGKGMLVKTCDKRKQTCTWKPYEMPDDDSLTLRVTMRIWGGSALFQSLETAEAKQAYLEEDSRRMTWLSAKAIAEMLLRKTAYPTEFVVLYCPPGTFGAGEELIRIYQRL